MCNSGGNAGITAARRKLAANAWRAAHHAPSLLRAGPRSSRVSNGSNIAFI